MILRGKVAFITGGGRDLGRSIALAMAREGARVVIMSRTAEELRKVVSLIRESGGEGHYWKGDVADPRDVSRGIGEAVREYGGLDILVNNAAVAGPAVLGKELHEHFVANKERGLLKNPESVALLAVYLASPSSNHLSGHFGTLDDYRRLGWPG